DAALLRRGSERRLLARAEGELADDVGIVDAVDRTDELVRLVSAFDLQALTAFERPADRLLHLTGKADAEHHAVDDSRTVREVLDRRVRDLRPQRDRAHHLAACLRSEERRVGKECRSWWAPDA